ncbi:MAG: VWA domain-containing protein [Cyanobacteria bacterium NC_groundwater_1444_Ag_S-0.65um_54_12]|nr:VWA domain-containing protein [Cyanobacteria bacterium NC_groundwater_1444_Ag_S-0.65um_54_12]
MTFDQPLWLLLVVLPAGWLVLAFRPRARGLPLPTFELLADLGYRSRSAPLAILRATVLLLLILALARPQWVKEDLDKNKLAVDLLLALDISGSMAAEDLLPNRLEAAKRVLIDFVVRMSDQRIGLLVFKAYALTVCPLTGDTQVVATALKSIDTQTINEDGTAIGDAIGTGLNRLAKGGATSQLIVLLTDGENNSGTMSPLVAAQMARMRGVKITTIAVGKSKGAPVPLIDSFGFKRYVRNSDGSLFLTRVDETTLKQIAQLTDGLFFSAGDTVGLAAAYQQIASLTRSSVKNQRQPRSRDFTPGLWLGACCLLFLELLLAIGPCWVLSAQPPGRLVRALTSLGGASREFFRAIRQ